MSTKRPPVPAQVRFEARRDELTALPMAERFRRIHDTNVWGSDESRSGLGSAFDATVGLRAALPGFLAKHEATSLLDIPCGDFGWLSTVRLDLDYVGADIVGAVVEGNEARYGGPGTRRRFARLDLTSDPLPAADVVLCRDCLVHLSFANVFRALANVRRSRSRYLLTTTFLEHDANADIEDGDWRMLNLSREPFLLPEPQDVLIERCLESDGAYADKALALWRVEDLPSNP